VRKLTPGGHVPAFPLRAVLLAALAFAGCAGGPGPGGGWKQVTPPEMAGVTLSDVTASGAGFEAVGTALGASNAQKGEAFKSPDGTTWVAAANEPFKDATLAGVATVHEGLLALGAGHCSLECGGFQSWLSTDGTTWSGPVKSTTAGDDARAIGVVEQGSTIVAVATELQDPSTNKNRGRVYLSTDANAWTDPLAPDALAQDIPTGIATDGTNLVVVGSTISQDGTHNGGAWRSTDGHAWRAGTDDGSFKGAQLMAVVHGTAGYIAVGAIGVDGAVWASSDGATWARVDGGAFKGSTLADVATNGTGDVAIGRGANGAAAWTSTDGKTWRSAGTIPGADGTRFVAVAIGSTASIIVGGAVGSPSGMVWLGPLP
jgi:hypothetical protein